MESHRKKLGIVMKNTCSKLVLKALMLTVITLSVTACGINYVKKDADALKGNEKVGILVARYDVMQATLLKGDVVISEKLNNVAAEKTSEEIKGQLAKKGFGAVVIPVGKASEIVKAYMAAHRYPHRTIDKPGEMALGDLSGTFKEYGIDYLLVYEADSIVDPSAISKLAGTATTATIGLLTGVVSSAATVHANTITYTGIVEQNGSLNYYNREQFTKTGNIMSPLHRDIMAESIVKRWIESKTTK